MNSPRHAVRRCRMSGLFNAAFMRCGPIWCFLWHTVTPSGGSVHSIAYGHQTLKALAEAVGGMVFSTVVRAILLRHGLRPRQVKTDMVSRHPHFEIKLRDMAGLYVNTPDHAAALSADGKTQIKSLGRTQAHLPMKPGHAETRTHDHRRNGAALRISWPSPAMPPGDRSRRPRACHPRQRLAAQVGVVASIFEAASGLDVPLHAGAGLVDECGGRVLCQTVAAEAETCRLQFA